MSVVTSSVSVAVAVNAVNGGAIASSAGPAYFYGFGVAAVLIWLCVSSDGSNKVKRSRQKDKKRMTEEEKARLFTELLKKNRGP